MAAVEHEDLARAALLEVTPESTVGSVVGTVDEGDGVVSVLFANRMPGYPGWRWTVSIAHVDGDEPTVLEVELMPGDGSLVAPDWVPWSDRLAEYRASQDDGAPADGEDADAEADESEQDDDEYDESDDELDDDADDDELDDDELDDDEDDLDESDDDDIDGVDVDELDETDDDDDEAVDEPEPAPARTSRRTRRVRPVDPDDDLELDRLDAGEVDPDRHSS